jgi:hypothetical protein
MVVPHRKHLRNSTAGYGDGLLFYMQMIIVPHRKHTCGLPQPVTEIALLFYNCCIFEFARTNNAVQSEEVSSKFSWNRYRFLHPIRTPFSFCVLCYAFLIFEGRLGWGVLPRYCEVAEVFFFPPLAAVDKRRILRKCHLSECWPHSTAQ